LNSMIFFLKIWMELDKKGKISFFFTILTLLAF
jgi:hypothetical protein